MIATNPLLGPQWEPIGHVLIRLLEDVKRGQMFSVQTYIRRFSLSPYTSPFLQAIKVEGGKVQMELSGNLQLEPKLSEAEYAELEFYGWSRPEVTEAEYREQGGGTNPNFVRFYEPNDDPVDIAEFLLVTLVGVFDMVEVDFWGFSTRAKADYVEGLKKLSRLKWSEGNPDRVIFALPGRHEEMCEPRQSADNLT
jgi:hypothetical protein